MSILVWTMMGIGFWHFAVLVPDRFRGGIIGAFFTAVAGAIASGLLLPTPGLPADNPPGVDEALYAIPGSLVALGASWWSGARREPQRAADLAAELAAEELHERSRSAA
ncbi:hypothetical protein [Paraconexibacter algicola]|uniref:Uncharacterized protein n=1 Tax=Paraconexibacter algicola TaxID=2133960 RepID=A0A2T4ULQ8_9ACTN|nr:hypothetical protein [Paraconexibacter algicola]PTL60144.1 hypothetical protein C7Y72_11070 [Paraconexibacter algicola]